MIRNIIFDLGNVLVNVDYTNFKQKLAEHGVAEARYNDFFGAGVNFKKYYDIGYESGKISTADFVNKCIHELDLKMSSTEYAAVFNDMFSEVVPMKRFLRKLSRESKYHLFLLSNTSPLHFDAIKAEYDYVNLLHKFGLSYELKSLKPGMEIYHRAMKLFNTKPEECIFIDDLKANCESAQSIGIRSVLYDKNNHAMFEKDFSAMIGAK